MQPWRCSAPESWKGCIFLKCHESGMSKMHFIGIFHGITSNYITGWWFQPLWKIWVRQLGWLFHSQLFLENHKIHVPVTTNQIIWASYGKHKWIIWMIEPRCKWDLHGYTLAVPEGYPPVIWHGNGKKSPVYVNCYLLCFHLSWHLSASHFELQVPILLLSLVLVDTKIAR